MGIIKNFKKAISLVSGDYICFLGADNRFRSDYLEKCKLVLDSDPEIGIAYTNIVVFGDRAGIMSAGSQIATEHEVIPGIYVRHYPENPDYDITERNYIHGSSMYKRIAYEEVGGYRKSETTEDHDLFTRILEHGWKAKLVTEPVLEYRQHSVSQANRVHGLSVKNALLTKRVNQLNTELKSAKRQIERLKAVPKQVDELVGARYRFFPVGSRREKSALFVLKVGKTGYRYTKKVLNRLRNSVKGSNG
jgi:glycosyltransferase involved in cell wall biosynthesis